MNKTGPPTKVGICLNLNFLNEHQGDGAQIYGHIGDNDLT
mgnify:CR=1 FL=1